MRRGLVDVIGVAAPLSTLTTISEEILLSRRSRRALAWIYLSRRECAHPMRGFGGTRAIPEVVGRSMRRFLQETAAHGVESKMRRDLIGITGVSAPPPTAERYRTACPSWLRSRRRYCSA
jgi:hypothetical protein